MICAGHVTRFFIQYHFIYNLYNCGNTCLSELQQEMIGQTDSDFNPTMAACDAFEKVLNCVKTSNLNFCLQLSPFSANISIKKTLVKDKSGFYLSPPAVTDSMLVQKPAKYRAYEESD